MDGEQKVREVYDYEVIRSSGGDAVLSFMGRTVLPEVVAGRLEADTLTIPETASGKALRFMALQERQGEMLREAGVVYLARVFGESISYSILNLSWDEREPTA